MASVPLEDLPEQYQKRYGFDPAQVAAYRAQVAAEAARIACAKAIRQWQESVKPFGGDLKVGLVGTVEENAFVVQVVDEWNALVKIYTD
jgi:hypothetical protein